MTKLSIKAKVTLWYALLMVVVIGFVLAIIFYVGNTVLTSSIDVEKHSIPIKKRRKKAM
ncbi:hypothetical protein IRB23M11_22380 [Alkalibacterium sp. m-11]|uniref:Uncharacterized protein n=1 Tax=Alkalibacterium indicireducens TaxID=398758 RepID=A0ABP3KCS0_9LACT